MQNVRQIVVEVERNSFENTCVTELLLKVTFNKQTRVHFVVQFYPRKNFVLTFCLLSLTLKSSLLTLFSCSSIHDDHAA